jgi:hypothetical protein
VSLGSCHCNAKYEDNMLSTVMRAAAVLFFATTIEGTYFDGTFHLHCAGTLPSFLGLTFALSYHLYDLRLVG